MNKAELIAAVAEHVELPKKTVAQVLNGLLGVIPMAVAAGDPVALIGFGTFDAIDKAERTARNPHTGAEIKVPACRAPRIRFGSDFKDLVNAGGKKPSEKSEPELIPA